MIINCPRCGFSQPQDQYCAQCGVNMQSFRPAEKSFAKKLSENIGLQVLILVIVAGFAGSYVIQSGTPPKWVQKFSKFQGVTKSTKTITATQTTAESQSEQALTATRNESLANLKNQEIILDQSVNAGAASQTLPTNRTENTNLAVARTQEAKDSTSDSAGVSFKLTYVEVSTDVLSKWISESSQLGLYQNLQDYSAGILPAFRKRADLIQQVLKSHEKKLLVGQTETFLSGAVGDDGQMIGLSANLEVKSFENSAVHGTLVITRALPAGREVFPAEFDLNKGAAFFIVDTLTRQNFLTEKDALRMAPFQVFKSLDFMAQRTKFVILLEPEIK
ncbi:MAG: hypothetical protein A2622_02910 [Bdellovibrionales bacterium RIFCSPHIGHO2_01_FULL_40_29]|nr:MAG: hypothetical protein A2622_02910 [Bdellovibrionales bacterium RIFCSPHIGHO2_01_FULL_40_29]OFZ34026.1 MAG: hypothetical protein A3D17_03330 [Bdellovibrionales bacterium RIFCSPHIGHO2_02_FULL_40_15]